MDTDGRLRRALAAFGAGPTWDLVDAALASAARDRPAELRARRDGIVERLYATAAGGRWELRRAEIGRARGGGGGGGFPGFAR